MPRLKVCGITDPAFAVAAAQRGVDYLGFIFAEGSPRCVTPERARAIRAALGPGGPRCVGVFVRQNVAAIRDIAATVPLDVVQLHSLRYTAADVAALQAAGYEVWRLDDADGTADAVLLDGPRGGSGLPADWTRVAALKAAGRRVVLAGGLAADNIRAAAATGADILDVNSSLETSPGVKSLSRLVTLLAQTA